MKKNSKTIALIVFAVFVVIVGIAIVIGIKMSHPKDDSPPKTEAITESTATTVAETEITTETTTETTTKPPTESQTKETVKKTTEVPTTKKKVTTTKQTPTTNNSINDSHEGNPDTGIGYDGKPLRYKHQDGSINTNPVGATQYEAFPGQWYDIYTPITQDPICPFCGLPCGDGRNGTCTRSLNGRTCEFCGEWIPVNTCHHCTN